MSRRAAEATLAAAGDGLGESDVEVSVVLGDDAFVRRLNRGYRGRDEATDVLSFAAADPGDLARPCAAKTPFPLVLGDVVVAFETARTDALAQSKPLRDHLSHLIVHGVLHLLGFDHGSEKDAEEMEALEGDVLAGLGVADPYGPRPRVR